MSAMRKSVAVMVLAAALSAAWLVGVGLVKDVQFARAEQQVEAARSQLANVQDLAAVFKAVGKIVEPSVVKIEVKKTIKNPVRRFQDDDLFRRFFRDRDGDGEPDVPDNFRFEIPDLPDEFQQQGTGSGVIVEVDGSTAYIVTNNHVAQNASEMVITLSDGRQISNGKVVGTDPKSDLALLKVEADHLIAAKWGNSDELEKGDIVMAFGSPFGYVGSMTQGIVSALNRDRVGIIGSQFAYENFIQVDAPINPGNSGGPLVNLKGEVVGINTAIASRTGGFQGIGFAIPANQAKFVYAALKEKGTVVRGWLGVEIDDVARRRDEVKELGYDADKGVIVKGTTRDAPAEGKLQPADIITAVNGKPVDGVRELRGIVAATTPGTDMKITVFRQGQQKDVTVKIGEQPDDVRSFASARQNRRETGQSDGDAVETLGLRLALPTEQLARKYDLGENPEGAVVTGVRGGSAAAMAGIRTGDLITKVDDQTVSSPTDLQELLAKKDLTKGLKVWLTNRDGARFVFIKTNQK